MKTNTHTTNYIEYDSLKHFTQNELDTIDHAKKAAKDAWAPYSGFKVGAAVLLENGEIIVGSNQENAAYPSGLCAERVALFSAHTQFPNKKVICMVVCAFKDGVLIDQPVTPCGSCRQVMVESNRRFGSPHKLIMHGKAKTIVVANSNELLPLMFDGEII
jgi:cytidine deaminase